MPKYCRHPARNRRGATLVELLVAILLLDMSLLSLAVVSAVAVRRMGEATRRSHAIVAASSRVESLLSSGCAPASSGSLTLERGVTEYWATQPVTFGAEMFDSVQIVSRTTESVIVRARRLC